MPSPPVKKQTQHSDRMGERERERERSRKNTGTGETGGGRDE